MQRWLVAGALALAFAAHDRAAHAIASSCRYDGWALPAGTTVPVRAHLAFYTDARNALSKKPVPLVAKIGGKVVPVKIAYVAAGPFELATIEIDSDLAGPLELAWQIPKDAGRYFDQPAAKYTIAKRAAIPTAAKGTASRYYHPFHHSTVHESENGLALQVDVPTVAFTVKTRRDAKAAWDTLVVPGATLGGKNLLHLGEVGCVTNFSVAQLEAGIDLEVSAQLADGSSVKVSGLPAHYVLPPLPKGADVSSP